MAILQSCALRKLICVPTVTLASVAAQVLLHHEQFKIPENLARFAVKAGMGGFVKKMGPAVVNFVANRRQRVDPVRLLCRLLCCAFRFPSLKAVSYRH